MAAISADELARITNFTRLVDLLRDKLDWPIGEDYGFEDVVFEYAPGELGLKPEEIAKIREIHQLRPLVDGQPWGIFFVSFEEKTISIAVLRRMLRALVVKKRAGSVAADRQTWQLHDLIFAANFGKSGERELAIVHFSDESGSGDLPVLKVLGWNAKDTFLHNDHVARVLTEKLHWPDEPDDKEQWRESWSAAFETRHNEVIQTSRDLAIRLASLATDIRARANELLKAEADDGAMRKMLEAFRKNLIQDLDEDGFADMFAQTIAYGLLAARISRPSGALVADNLTDMVPKTNPFLRELFETFLSLGGRDKRKEMDFDELGVRNVVDLLVRTNMEAVLRDFGDRNPKEDPVIHFYELFLKEYDPQKRMQRGVFYTPRPVVNFIVRGVDEILRTEFDLPLGFADTTTWTELAARNDKITIPEHVDPNTSFVQILDPATGTGTFLVEVIDLIHKRMMAHWRAEKWSDAEIQRRWNEYVPHHLLPRLTGFELMMAPYAIAHMKIGLKLVETGYKFGSDERAHVFLTNALDLPSGGVDQKEFEELAPALAHEVAAVNAVKSNISATAIIGNPPYSNYGQLNRSAHMSALLELYKKGLGEKKLNLDDDYIKFIRYTHELLAGVDVGVAGLITNHTYLDGITHRQMRSSLLDVFNGITIVDLHGSIKKAEKSPDGSKDSNVFDIQQGVAIAFLRRLPDRARRVQHCDVWGGRQSKNAWLEENSVLSVPLADISPAPDRYYFCPAVNVADSEYSHFISLTDCFRIGATGFETARDHFAIAFTSRELRSRLSDLLGVESDEAIRARWGLDDKRDWQLTKARQRLKSLSDPYAGIRICCYRPFDTRLTHYDDVVVTWPRKSSLGGISASNPALVASRMVKGEAPCHFFVVDKPAEKIFISGKTSNNAFVFPLASMGGKIIGGDDIQSNLSALLKNRFSEFVGDAKCHDWRKADRALVSYIYAVFHSPGYRTRYAQFLKSDFPRIPTPDSRELFATLVPLGAELVALHLLKPDEAPVLESPGIRFAGHGEARVERGYPKYENGKVMINATRWFEDVPKATWDFHVGGYQVCEKWLKDRAGKGGQKPKPGRTLTDEDILHYRRVVVALTETCRIMIEIDRVIDAHGGWPGAFASPAA